MSEIVGVFLFLIVALGILCYLIKIIADSTAPRPLKSAKNRYHRELTKYYIKKIREMK